NDTGRVTCEVPQRTRPADRVPGVHGVAHIVGMFPAWRHQTALSDHASGRHSEKKMNRPFFLSLVPAKCAGIAALALLPAVTPAAVAGDWSPQAAADFLDGRADWWLGWDAAARGNGTACLSCHTAVPFALGRSALGRRVGESEAQRRMVAGVARRVANWDKLVRDGSTGGDFPLFPPEAKPSEPPTGTGAIAP